MAEKKDLTVWNFLVWIQVFIDIHGKIHHIRIAEEVQLSLQQLLFIVDLVTNTKKKNKTIFISQIIYLGFLTPQQKQRK